MNGERQYSCINDKYIFTFDIFILTASDKLWAGVPFVFVKSIMQ